MEKIRELINKLPATDKNLLDSLIKVQELKKGELVFSDLDADNSIYYVEKGILRKYINKDGNEKTIDFYFTDEIYFPLIMHENKLTNCFLKAIEKSKIFKIDLQQFEKLKMQSLKLVLLENTIVEAVLEQTAERLQNFQTMNATERYLNLLNRNKKIAKHISLTYIASYLGINNASLSKIRANIR